MFVTRGRFDDMALERDIAKEYAEHYRRKSEALEAEITRLRERLAPFERVRGERGRFVKLGEVA